MKLHDYVTIATSPRRLFKGGGLNILYNAIKIAKNIPNKSVTRSTIRITREYNLSSIFGGLNFLLKFFCNIKLYLFLNYSIRNIDIFYRYYDICDNVSGFYIINKIYIVNYY